MADRTFLGLAVQRLTSGARWAARRTDPELLLRILLIGYLYGITSERGNAIIDGREER